MEMHQIRYFLSVCETGNFTRAAHSACVSQPSLTQAIGKLEEELGGKLFLRDRGGCRLTELGRVVEPNLRRIHDHSQTTKSDAATNDSPVRNAVNPNSSALYGSPFMSQNMSVTCSPL